VRRPAAGRGLLLAVLASPAVVSFGGGDAPELIPIEVPDVVMESYRAPDRDEVCRAGGTIEFTLAGSAAVSLDVAGRPARVHIDGKPALLSDLPLQAGEHRVRVQPGEVKVSRLAAVPFEIRARGADGRVEKRTGRFLDEIANRAVLPVGRTFVRGVDILDGHLAIQTSDLKLAGRHLALEVTRTYSSAGQASRSVLGAGWAMNHDTSVTALEACGLVVVRTADGGSQAFRPGPSGALVPQRGYHTELRRNPDGSFDFIDKAATRHHFAAPVEPGSPTLRLEYIEEPHGDRIVPTYDSLGRLLRVDEWHPSLGPVRSLLFEHQKVGGAWRISRVRAWGLGIEARYRYDRWGNLVLASRTDVESPGYSWNDRYEYSIDSPRDRHQLVTALPAGQARTTYRYFAASDPFPGGDAPSTALTWGGKEEFVKAVEEEAASDDLDFSFDHAGAVRGAYRVEVRTPGGPATRYELNADGNTLLIDEPTPPGRTVWRMDWDPRHLVKVRATNDRGRMAEYAHDERGNLTSERERETATGRIRTTLYAYDRRFNKLTTKQDPAGAVTRYALNPRTGDLVRTVGPDGKVTTYTHTREGCLAEEAQSGVRTAYAGHDTFCQASRVTAPGGEVTGIRYDARGRRRDGAEDARKAPSGGVADR